MNTAWFSTVINQFSETRETITARHLIGYGDNELSLDFVFAAINYMNLDPRKLSKDEVIRIRLFYEEREQERQRRKALEETIKLQAQRIEELEAAWKRRRRRKSMRNLTFKESKEGSRLTARKKKRPEADL